MVSQHNSRPPLSDPQQGVLSSTHQEIASLRKSKEREEPLQRRKRRRKRGKREKSDSATDGAYTLTASVCASNYGADTDTSDDPTHDVPTLSLSNLLKSNSAASDILHHPEVTPSAPSMVPTSNADSRDTQKRQEFPIKSESNLAPSAGARDESALRQERRKNPLNTGVGIYTNGSYQMSYGPFVALHAGIPVASPADGFRTSPSVVAANVGIGSVPAPPESVLQAACLHDYSKSLGPADPGGIPIQISSSTEAKFEIGMNITKTHAHAWFRFDSRDDNRQVEQLERVVFEDNGVVKALRLAVAVDQDRLVFGDSAFLVQRTEGSIQQQVLTQFHPSYCDSTKNFRSYEDAVGAARTREPTVAHAWTAFFAKLWFSIVQLISHRYPKQWQARTEVKARVAIFDELASYHAHFLKETILPMQLPKFMVVYPRSIQIDSRFEEMYSCLEKPDLIARVLAGEHSADHRAGAQWGGVVWTCDDALRMEDCSAPTDAIIEQIYQDAISALSQRLSDN